MINPDVKIADNWFNKDELENKSTRDGYGRGVVEAGEQDERIEFPKPYATIPGVLRWRRPELYGSLVEQES